MKASDLKKVDEILKSLEIAESDHRLYKSLTQKGTGMYGMDKKARIVISSDPYSQERPVQFELKVLDVPEIVRMCRKKESEAWGIVVGLRAELRSLGVEV